MRLVECEDTQRNNDMSESRETVLKAALELEEGDRILLATQLMESVAENLPGWSVDDPELLEELERRSNDGSTAIPWDQVRDELRAELGK